MPIVEDNTSKIFKDEITLNINSFDKEIILKDREALASMLRTLVIVKKGTYPNNPDFGVGIEDYLFDFLNDNKISELEDEIDNQIQKWIEKSPNLNIKTKIHKSKSYSNGNYCNLVLFFTITRNNDFEYDNSKIDDYTITLYVTGDTQNRKVLSKLRF